MRTTSRLEMNLQQSCLNPTASQTQTTEWLKAFETGAGGLRCHLRESALARKSHMSTLGEVAWRFPATQILMGAG